MIEIRTVFDAYQLYYQYLESTRPTLLYNLNTAIIRYTLPGYGIPSGLKIADAVNFMKEISMHQFVDALNVQQSVFNSKDVEPNQRRSHRYMLNGFLEWCAAQEWWTAATRANPGEYAPRIRARKGTACKVRSTNKKAKEPYKLKIEEIPKPLHDEFEALCEFWSEDFELYSGSRKKKNLRPGSVQTYLDNLLYFFGWLHHVLDFPSQQLSLKLLDDFKLIRQFDKWLKKVREVKPATEAQRLIAIMNVLKFLYHEEPNRGKNFKNIQIIEDVREMINAAVERTEQEPLEVDESLKVQERGHLLYILEQLEKQCAPKYNNGKVREPHTIAWDVQQFLVIGLLAYLVDRGQTIRELKLNETLVQINGRWHIKQNASQYKTGDKYGDRILPVPDRLCKVLEDWLNQWRSYLNPNHDFVFTEGKKSRKPFSRSRLGGFVNNAIFSVSGKLMNPHHARAITITHFYDLGISDADKRALAEFMAHSPETARKFYDKRTKHRRIKPAIDLLFEGEAVKPPLPQLEPVKLDPIPLPEETQE